MTATRKLTSITTAAALAVTALGPLATSASAEGWRDGRRGDAHYAYARSERRHHGRRHAHRHHKAHDTEKYVALGIGALMLGLIISEAAR